MAGIVSTYLQRPEEGERWAKLSEVSLERLGTSDERLRSWLLNDRAVMRQNDGQLRESLRLVRDALAIKRCVLPPDDPDIAHSLLTEAETLHRMGDDAGALAKNDEARGLLVPVYGLNAVIVAQSLSNRGEYLAGLGLYPAALGSFQDALSHWQPEVGPSGQFLAYPLTGMGRALLALGRPAEARAPLERVLSIRDVTEPDPTQRAETAFALARALWEIGDRKRARELARAASADYGKGPATHRSDAQDVDRWLSHHP